MNRLPTWSRSIGIAPEPDSPVALSGVSAVRLPAASTAKPASVLLAEFVAYAKRPSAVMVTQHVAAPWVLIDAVIGVSLPSAASAYDVSAPCVSETMGWL